MKKEFESENKTIAKQYLIDLHQNQEFELLDKLISDSYLKRPNNDSLTKYFSILSYFPAVDITSLKQRIIDVHNAFDNLKFIIIEMIEEGDVIVIFWKLKGKWIKSWWGLPPTNKNLELLCINILRINKKKILENFLLFDTLKLLSDSGKVHINVDKEDMDQYLNALKKLSILPGKI